jgi:hypothetical protein
LLQLDFYLQGAFAVVAHNFQAQPLNHQQPPGFIGFSEPRAGGEVELHEPLQGAEVGLPFAVHALEVVNQGSAFQAELVLHALALAQGEVGDALGAAHGGSVGRFKQAVHTEHERRQFSRCGHIQFFLARFVLRNHGALTADQQSEFGLREAQFVAQLAGATWPFDFTHGFHG